LDKTSRQAGSTSVVKSRYFVGNGVGYRLHSFVILCFVNRASLYNLAIESN